jgi:hypothetical protein
MKFITILICLIPLHVMSGVIRGQIMRPTLDIAVDKKLNCGQNIVKFIAKNNITKGLTTEQIKTMTTTYSLVFDLLKGGAMNTAIIEINAITPDALVTAQDKIDIVAEIATCN